MRKSFIIICLLNISISILLLSACDGSLVSDSSSAPVPSSSTLMEDTPSSSIEPVSELDLAASSFEKPFGTYSIAEAWFESEDLSSNDAFFYLKAGISLDTPTSNISVSMGENKYGADDYLSFARAIDRQLKMQVTSDVTEYFGGGSFTDNGYPLITMTIVEGNMRTIQYYIVGDFRYVMVHATDFGNEQIPDVEEAALVIVNSFVWAE